MTDTNVSGLTPEQEAALPEIRDRWFAHGISSQPANRQEAEEGIRMAYASAGHAPPKHYIWVQSPYAGSIALGLIPQAITAATELVEKITAAAVAGEKSSSTDWTVPPVPLDLAAVQSWWRNAIYGQHSSGYYGYLEAMRLIGMPGLEGIDGVLQVAQNAGWWWPAEEFVIICERPTVMSFDQQRRLHGENGPAIAYPDGFAAWMWHGTRVPQELIEDRWTVADILREPNAEVRRCAIEKMGWDRFVKEAKLKRIGKAVDDPGNPGHKLSLYDIPEQVYSEPVRVLLCDNATPERDGTRRRFGLTVPADISDPIAAAAWTFDLSADEYKTMVNAY